LINFSKDLLGYFKIMYIPCYIMSTTQYNSFFSYKTKKMNG